MADAETIAILKSIDLSLRTLVTIAKQKAEARVKNAAQQPGQAVASDADLDGKFGDPEIKLKDPRDWSGPTMVGRHFSECPVEYLELLADRYEYFISQNAGQTDDDKKKLKYNRADAARARGWAERIRSGKHKQTEPEAEPEGWA